MSLIENYLASNKFRYSTVFSTKKRSLQDIKNESENLPNIKKLSNRFEKNCFSPLKKILSDNKSLPEIKNSEIQSMVMDLGLYHSLIKENDSINENLAVLSYYLPQLKAHKIVQDDEKKKRVLSKFMNSNDFSIKKTLSMIEKFKFDIVSLDKQYDKTLSSLSSVLPLEQSVKINNNKHSKFLKELHDISNEQHELAFHIGKSFVEITKDIEKYN